MPTRRFTRTFFLVGFATLATALAGCDVDDAAKPMTFTEINEKILKPNCTFACHSGGPDAAAGSLDLEIDPYKELVGAAAGSLDCMSSSLLRVEAGAPEKSLLFVMSEAKIQGTPPPCGDTMLLGDDRPSLSPEDLEAVRAWIADGAKND
jgi:hypothetical protein